MSINRQTCSKSERLSGVNRVDSLFKDGSSFVCYPFRVIWKATPVEEGSSVCFLVSVSKRKLKHAVDRNRVKRLVREAYRLNKQHLLDTIAEGSTFHVAFIWIPSEILSFEKVNQKMNVSLRRLVDAGTEKTIRDEESNKYNGVV